MDVIREIEKQIDNWVRSRPFLKNPLPYSIWYLLTVHEDYIESFAFNSSNLSTLSIPLDYGKYALKYCLTWMHDVSPKKNAFQRPTYINKRRYQETKDLFEVGLDYTSVESAYVIYSKGWTTAEVIDAHTVKFTRAPTEIAYDVLDRLINKERDDKTFSSSSKCIMQSNALKKILDSVKPIGTNAITYKIDNDILYDVVPNPINILKGMFLFPSDWKFRNISIGAFRDVWRILNTLCGIHFLCRCYAYNQFRSIAGCSKVLLMNRDELIDKISATCSGAKQEITDILALMQYDPSLPPRKRDPALQPLIEISKGLLALAPQFIMGCNHERNLMALLARHFKNEYDRTTGTLENALIDEIESQLSSTNFYLAYRRKIPGHKELPDIDLVIANPSSSILLMVELKWVIQPSESWEIIARSETEQKGIKQAKKLLDFGREHLDELWGACFPTKKIPPNLSIYTCVAMRGFCGTNKNWTPEAPVIELSLLLNKLKKETNLELIVNWLKSRKFLPVEGKEYKTVEYSVKIGDYTVIWEGCEIIKADLTI